jgi:hypothetical protein
MVQVQFQPRAATHHRNTQATTQQQHAGLTVKNPFSFVGVG